MRTQISTIIATGLLFASISPAAGAELLEKKVYTDAKGAKLPYRLLSPQSFASKTRPKEFALVVFLHGAGERGDDNEKQLVHGVPEFAKTERQTLYPFYLVAPQCPNGKKWCEVDWSAASHKMPAEPSEPMRLLFELLDNLTKELPIDKSRIYITGLSMGGYGTWDAIARRPDYFAAAAPICGGGDETTAEKIKHIPIWCFHGGKDGVVKPERSRNMIEALKKAGASPEPKYTEYPEKGHDSWVPAYKDEELYKWMFGQVKK